MRTGYFLGVAGLLAWGCAAHSDDSSVLAKVGEVRIKIADLKGFQESLPPSYRRSKVESEARRDDLQTLIDRKLMDLDASSRKLGEDPQVLEKLKKQEDVKLVDEMLNRQVRTRVSISEEDIVREYQQKGWEEQVETQEFFVATREKAEEVVGLLGDGVDFNEVARSFALDRVLKVLSGKPQGFKYSPQDQPRAVVEAVFALPQGGITEPLPQLGGFVFARVVGRHKVELEEVRDEVEQTVLKKSKKLFRSVYLIELRKQYKLEFNQEGMDLVVQVLREKADLAAAQQSAVVYTYAGGVLRVEEVLEAVRRERRAWPEIEEKYIIAHLKENTLPNRLMALDGRKRGVDREEGFQQWREVQKKDLMAARLRSQLLQEKLKITQEDLGNFYQTHKSRYTNPDRARGQELLTADQDRARALRQEIEKGADMAALIKEHSIRKSPADGNLRVSTPQAPFYGQEWIDTVMNAPLQQVQGPVQTRGGYSIFRVIERYPEEAFPLQGKVLRLVRKGVKEEKERDIFNQYLKDLRQKYAHRVEIYEEHLERL